MSIMGMFQQLGPVASMDGGYPSLEPTRKLQYRPDTNGNYKSAHRQNENALNADDREVQHSEAVRLMPVGIEPNPIQCQPDRGKREASDDEGDKDQLRSTVRLAIPHQLVNHQSETSDSNNGADDFRLKRSPEKKKPRCGRNQQREVLEQSSTFEQLNHTCTSLRAERYLRRLFVLPRGF
jgi:hypothetical protein